MKKYTLTMTSFERQTIKLRFPYKGQMLDKMTLMDIDKYTTQFESQEELSKRITGKIDGGHDFRITYLSKGFVKDVPVALSDKKELTQIKTVGETANVELSSSNKAFYSIINRFIQGVFNDRTLFVRAMSGNTLNDKQKEYLDMIVKNGGSDAFQIRKFQEHTATYRQVRNLLFLMELNELEKKKVSTVDALQVDEEEDGIDPDEYAFLSDEELEMMGENYRR